MTEFELRPNYPGILVAAVMSLGGAAMIAPLVWHLPGTYEPAFVSEWVMIAFIVVLLSIVLLGLTEVFLDGLRVALSGLRESWRVRITREGLHYPLLSARPIPWPSIRDVSVQYGYNGKDIWLELDPALKVFNPSLMNLFLSLLKRQKVNYLKLGSHKFRLDADAFQRALAELTSDREVGHYTF